MWKDGRVRIPQLVLTLLQEEKSDRCGRILEVIVEPGTQSTKD